MIIGGRVNGLLTQEIANAAGKLPRMSRQPASIMPVWNPTVGVRPTRSPIADAAGDGFALESPGSRSGAATGARAGWCLPVLLRVAIWRRWRMRNFLNTG